MVQAKVGVSWDGQGQAKELAKTTSMEVLTVIELQGCV